MNISQSAAAIIVFSVLLIAFVAVLIAFVIIIYLYCMKKKIFSQFLTILRSKSRKNGAKSKERNIALANGALLTLACRPDENGCSISSVQFNSFQRMPTILEEAENDVESRISSSRELNEAYAVNQLTLQL
ncbi:unnamed protein product [Litomosoides sigmodontis]|uniref:Uncharacterized protein n=1 Tax=Litomosoides sigmodontis TaxID=42156 RepID=A0A3P6TYQ4_LITSI|nr:unnamed protein product [Litomosoides sigmodontis]